MERSIRKWVLWILLYNIKLKSVYLPKDLDECFSKKVSYYTDVLVVSSAYTSKLSITGKCDAD